MCRGKSEGGRRCRGCAGTAGRAAHNARRRRNRELKREIIEEAQQQGIAPEVVDELRGKPPAAAKEWARAHGLPSRFHPGRGHDANPGPVEPAPADAAPAPLASPSWMTADLAVQIARGMTRQGGHRDERSLLAGEVVAESTPAQGINETLRVELDNGVTGYFKSFAGADHSTARGFGQGSAQQSIHEVAAWRTAAAMGPPYDELVPPCVLRKVHDEYGSLALERPGIRPTRETVTGSPEWRAAAFFDAFIGQQDRHGGNLLVAGDRLALIDHGFSFTGEGDYLNHSLILQERNATSADRDADVLSPAEAGVLSRFLGDPDRFGLRGLIEPHRLEAMEHRAQEMLTTRRLPSNAYLWELKMI